MLELENIKKDYHLGSIDVHALKGISLLFRKNEFVAVLGQSGCGKTSMLNIIGGLDKYTEGNLYINGTSTKEYKDRDWDSYRNHSIGFVFQNYNLIPHQSVLQNVELALTLSGVGKVERRERAIKVLNEVGLGDQLEKKPSEMSGGQMQRVAIARALVNNPDIILADEPTGALDSDTSTQVMDIMKEISKDHLIIMVTHNPEIAEKYASRIIRMLDGEIISDTNPLTKEEIESEREYDEAKQLERKNKKKRFPSMSYFTALALSLRNLFTKKGRTLLTSFAGSIGIIGIALIIAISQGTTKYIEQIQEETLAEYPFIIDETSTDYSTILDAVSGMDTEATTHNTDGVYIRSFIYDMFDTSSMFEMHDNDLSAFKAYIEAQYEDESSDFHNAISAVKYTYDLPLTIYTKNSEGKIVSTDSDKLMNQLFFGGVGEDVTSVMDVEGINSSQLGGLLYSRVNVWKEMLPGLDGEVVSPLITNQYELVSGKWPENYDEIVLVLDKNNELDDLSLYTLGILDDQYVVDVCQAALNGESTDSQSICWSYEELMGKEYHLILPSSTFSFNENTCTYEDISNTQAGLQYLYDNAIILKIVGIIKPDEDSKTTLISGGIGYTTLLTEYIISQSENSEAVLYQLAHPDVDIFSGLYFKNVATDIDDKDKSNILQDYIALLSDEEKAKEYYELCINPSNEIVMFYLNQYLQEYSMEELMGIVSDEMAESMGISIEDISVYLQNMSEEELTMIIEGMLRQDIISKYVKEFEEKYDGMSEEELSALFDSMIEGYTDEDYIKLYDEMIEYSGSTLEKNLSILGYVDINAPSSISLYVSSFENKDILNRVISEYNDTNENQIVYTDIVEIIIGL